MALFAGSLTDWRGRKECILTSALITIVGGVIQGAAQNVGMFIAGRFIIGLGLGLAQVSTPTLVAETAPVEWRGFALGLYYAFWGVGTLIASGVCYGVSITTLLWKKNHSHDVDTKSGYNMGMAHSVFASSLPRNLRSIHPDLRPRITSMAGISRSPRRSFRSPGHCKLRWRCLISHCTSTIQRD